MPPGRPPKDDPRHSPSLPLEERLRQMDPAVKARAREMFAHGYSEEEVGIECEMGKAAAKRIKADMETEQKAGREALLSKTANAGAKRMVLERVQKMLVKSEARQRAYQDLIDKGIEPEKQLAGSREEDKLQILLMDKSGWFGALELPEAEEKTEDTPKDNAINQFMGMLKQHRTTDDAGISDETLERAVSRSSDFEEEEDFL